MGAPGQSVPGARSWGTHFRGCAWRWSHARGWDLGSGPSFATNLGGEEVGPCWRDRGAKVTSEGRDDPGRGSWRLVCPRAGEGCGSELCGGAVLFYQVEGLSHLGGSWAFLVADRDPLGAGPCQVEEWELGPVGVALGGWAALWGQCFRLHCRLRRVLG